MATRAKWIKRVEEWKRSGLEVAEFARRDGLNPQRFYWWCWKLGACPPPAELRLLPVRDAEPSLPPAPAWIEIPLPKGGLVCVMPGVDSGTLACVVAVAAELSAKGVVAARPVPVTQVALRQSRR